MATLDSENKIFDKPSKLGVALGCTGGWDRKKGK